MTDRARLDAALLRAHAAQDRGALIALYSEAAETTPPAEAAFFLTQAMVFALEAGDPRADALRTRLIDMGCDAPV